MKPLKVYIAGPYTRSTGSTADPVVNVRNAIVAADDIMRTGHLPYVPHLTHFWHYLRPHPYEDWLRLDLAWLESCDVLVRLRGESPGADREAARARELGIPVFDGVSAFMIAYSRDEMPKHGD